MNHVQLILVVPISNPSEDQIQVNYHEGYEAVDVAISTNSTVIWVFL